MKVLHRVLLLISSVVTVGVPAAGAGPSAALVAYRNIPLWDAGHVPGATGDGPLDAPFLTVFEPRGAAANGGAVVIAPGGGNIMLMYGGEGADIAEACVTSKEPEGAGVGCVSRAARRKLLRRSVRAPDLRALGGLALTAGAPHGGVPPGARTMSGAIHRATVSFSPAVFLRPG